MIELINVSKKYNATWALQNINLFIQEGEIFGIIGRSGAGKSTLLRCINALEFPDEGEVVIDNENILHLNSSALRATRQKMAMIFQHFNLLQSKNVSENIALPLRIQGMSKANIGHKIDELLSLVELEEKANFYPAQLSGGQKQRVAIARALSCSPKILLCDEATSALDPETTFSILELLRKINQLYGLTIILITHEMEVVKRICHRLAVMEAARVVESTALSEVFNKQNSQARHLLFAHLSPELPSCLKQSLSSVPNNKPLLRLFFRGEHATVPFISKTSRELNLDINILLANIDRFDAITYGVLIVELSAEEDLLKVFMQRCQEASLIVEILGYVIDPYI